MWSSSSLLRLKRRHYELSYELNLNKTYIYVICCSLFIPDIKPACVYKNIKTVQIDLYNVTTVWLGID